MKKISDIGAAQIALMIGLIAYFAIKAIILTAFLYAFAGKIAADKVNAMEEEENQRKLEERRVIAQ